MAFPKSIYKNSWSDMVVRIYNPSYSGGKIKIKTMGVPSQSEQKVSKDTSQPASQAWWYAPCEVLHRRHRKEDHGPDWLQIK
jgi:hypothetical protein